MQNDPETKQNLKKNKGYNYLRFIRGIVVPPLGQLKGLTDRGRTRGLSKGLRGYLVVQYGSKALMS